VLKEMERLQRLVDVNRKRELNTYGNMFSKNASVSDYVAKKVKTEPLNYKSVEDKEFDEEKKKME